MKGEVLCSVLVLLPSVGAVCNAALLALKLCQSGKPCHQEGKMTEMGNHWSQAELEKSMGQFAVVSCCDDCFLFKYFSALNHFAATSNFCNGSSGSWAAACQQPGLGVWG